MLKEEAIKYSDMIFSLDPEIRELAFNLLDTEWDLYIHVRYDPNSKQYVLYEYGPRIKDILKTIVNNPDIYSKSNPYVSLYESLIPLLLENCVTERR